MCVLITENIYAVNYYIYPLLLAYIMPDTLHSVCVDFYFSHRLAQRSGAMLSPSRVTPTVFHCSSTAVMTASLSAPWRCCSSR